MGAVTGVMQGFNSVNNAVSQAAAAKLQGQYQAQQFETNTWISEFQGAQAEQRGATGANRVRRNATQVKGAQRASFAASGVDSEFGSAADAQAETDLLSELDVISVKSNAWREAWGYKVAANNSRFSGQMAVNAAENTARNTILTGGMQAVGYGAQSTYYARKESK